MALVENIKQICAERRITVSEVEERAGLAKNSIYKWNRHSPSVKTAEKVAMVLETTVDRLIKGKD